MKEKAWVQAAVDVEDYSLAQRIAAMALDNGAEWIEIGTPLLYKYGYEAIRRMRGFVGRNAVLVADFKYPVSFMFAHHVAEAGADFLLTSDIYKDFLVTKSIEYCRNLGLGLIFDMEVKASDFGQRLIELEKLGVEYVFAHHYDSARSPSGEMSRIDTLDELVRQGTSVKIGITSDNYEEACDAVKKGADWITFGVALSKADDELCRKWIDMIHTAR